jgi:MFS family permease
MAAHFAADAMAGDETALWTRLVLTGPALTIALSAWGIGWLLDRVGRLRPLWGALLLYAAAGSAGLWLDSLPAVVSRLLLGLAVAVIMTAATALVGDLFQGSARERFLSRQAAFMGYGGVVFLSLGGALAAWHWRGPFAVYLCSLPVMALAWMTLRPLFRDRPPVATPSPEAGAALHEGWLPGLLHLFAAITFIGFYQVPSQLPFLLGQIAPEVPPWLVGLVVATLNLVAASVAMAYGRLRRWLAYAHIMALGFGLLGAGLGVIALAAQMGQPLAFAWGGTALAGVGLGMAMPNMTVWLLSLVPPQIRGRSAGGQTAGVFLGQFLAPLLAQPLVAAYSIGAAFAGAAGLLAVTALSCLLLTGRGRAEK